MYSKSVSFAIVRGQSVEELTSDAFWDADGILHPSSVPYHWSEEELADIGVYPITAEPIPIGHRVLSSELEFRNGTVIRRYTTEAISSVDLTVLKLQLKAEIDNQAELERYNYITPGSGQAMIYQAKFEEAQSILAIDEAVTIDATDYPLLSAEVGITGDTIRAVAAVILAAHKQWLRFGAAIETVRLGAKAQVDEAYDEQAARAIAPIWPGTSTA